MTSSSDTPRIPWVIPAIVAGAVLLSLAAVLAFKWGLTWPCPFKFFFGLPCPTCGTTRSFAALASFDLARCLRFNPLVLLGGAGAILGACLHRRFPWIRHHGLTIFLVAFALNWVYLLLFLPR